MIFFAYYCIIYVYLNKQSVIIQDEDKIPRIEPTITSQKVC